MQRRGTPISKIHVCSFYVPCYHGYICIFVVFVMYENGGKALSNNSPDRQHEIPNHASLKRNCLHLMNVFVRNAALLVLPLFFCCPNFSISQKESNLLWSTLFGGFYFNSKIQFSGEKTSRCYIKASVVAWRTCNVKGEGCGMEEGSGGRG